MTYQACRHTADDDLRNRSTTPANESLRLTARDGLIHRSLLSSTPSTISASSLVGSFTLAVDELEIKQAPLLAEGEKEIEVDSDSDDSAGDEPILVLDWPRLREKWLWQPPPNRRSGRRCHPCSPRSLWRGRLRRPAPRRHAALAQFPPRPQRQALPPFGSQFRSWDRALGHYLFNKQHIILVIRFRKRLC